MKQCPHTAIPSESTTHTLLISNDYLLNGNGDRDLDLASCPSFCSIFTLAGSVMLRLRKFLEEDDMIVF